MQCSHGKPGPCRFVNARGLGCRFGDGCRFCHVCKRVSTLDRIKQTLTAHREAAAKRPAPARSQGSGDGEHRPSGLLRLLASCAELFLEGPLGESLAAEVFCAFLCTHRAAAGLAKGAAERVFWKLRLRSLQASGLNVDGQLAEELEPEALRHAVQALNSLRCKSGWDLCTKEAVLGAAEAAQAAREESSDGAQLFGISVHFRGRPQGARNTEHGGVDDDPGGEEAEEPLGALASASTWVEGGCFVMPDGSCCQLSPRIMWSFDGENQLRRVLMSNVRLRGMPPSVQLQVRLWSAMPELCRVEGLALLQTCALSAQEVRALLDVSDVIGELAEEEPRREAAASPPALRMIAAVECTQRFWRVEMT